jgi:hypothetical protein
MKHVTLSLQKPPTRINAVYVKKSLFIVRPIRYTEVHPAGRMQSFSMLKQVVPV